MKDINSLTAYPNYADKGWKFTNLVRVLWPLPPDALDLNNWVIEQSPVACAVGWAAKDPWFIARGLRIENGCPVYGRWRCWVAVRRFFTLSRREADALFLETAYPSPPTPHCLIHRIQAMRLLSGPLPFAFLVSGIKPRPHTPPA